MSDNLPLIMLVVFGMCGLIGAAVFIAWPLFKPKNNLNRNSARESLNKIAEVGVEGGDVKFSNTELTLEKKLKFAQSKLSIKSYYVYATIISLIAFIIAFMKLNILYQALALFIGPNVMNAIVMYSVNKRFKMFDRDYPPFLLSLVGLLKTGMNPLQAIAAAAKNLDDDSLVRQEVELMLERLRLGVAEDKSVGAFGEDINHPEIELFVQALLLSRRVGGTLSDTLERLSKQVRRRQFFRMQAVAAVGLQRGSIWFIVVIQAALMTFIYFILPSFVEESFENPFGWQVWQFGIIVMMLGMYWVKKVSNIRC